MLHVLIRLYGPHDSRKPTFQINLTKTQVDVELGFHESSFVDFPEEDGVRSFSDPCESSNEFLVADQTNMNGLIQRVSDEIISYDGLLDDVDEEGSDEFYTFTKKYNTLREIHQSLTNLCQSN